ncbi:hypothetical protein MtrunA17_Chr4g0037961 [Medicago truncatula]|uniref:Uncharacterized protein n=1 Tax=Medicago truncatula TaxID=3880 RepID=A0A396I7G0_MEDTR|nr:hypothetical protein MtrunA17_Chr4g0037961 [Medicago truncatula]
MDVLHNLNTLYKFSIHKDFSEFCRVQPLLHIYEVSKFLLKFKCFNHGHGNLKTLERFYRQPIESVLHHVVPLDWKKSLAKEMVYQRITEAWQEIMKEAINENTKQKDRLTYGQIGRVVVMILGTDNVKDDLFLQVMTRFEDNKHWKDFIQSLRFYSAHETVRDYKVTFEMHPTCKLYQALRYTWSVNWIKDVDYISPSCFMYLVEQLLLLTSCLRGRLIYATKSSFTEWLICQNKFPLSDLSFKRDTRDVLDFIANFLREFVNDQNDFKTWIKKSKLDVDNYFPSLFLRSVVSMCLLHLSTGSREYLEILRSLLKNSYMTTQLPLEFRNVLQKGKKRMGFQVIAKAFKVIGNPLVIVKLQNSSSEIMCSDAVFVDLTTCKKRELVFETLFPSIVDSAGGETKTKASESKC